MPILPLLKTRNYFISSAGSIFKVENGKEVLVKPFQTKRSKEVLISIDSKIYNLLHLMVEHFHGDLKITDRVKFTVNSNLEIPSGSIIIKPALGLMGISKEDEVLMFQYKCDIKASAANSRCEQKVNAVDVFRTLKIHSFKCIYCGYVFPKRNWHLDHFVSISKGGKNILENIVPSCDKCNIMKGAMDGNQFYSQCQQIVKNYMFKR